MGGKSSKPTDFNTLLDKRKDCAQDYIDKLYAVEQPALLLHEQWHHVSKHYEEKPLNAFAGAGGVIQAWDLNGVAVVTAKALAKPIVPESGDGLRQYGFHSKQIKDAELVAAKLNVMKTDVVYTTGIAHCVTYEPVCYIHNNLMHYNALMAHQRKYDPKKMTSICLGGTSGDNSINKHNLLNLIRPLVGRRILSKRVRVVFETPTSPVKMWSIDEFLKGDRFMTRDELNEAHPDCFALLSEDSITVEYHTNVDETVVTLPHLFCVERTKLKRMVVVPTGTRGASALSKASAAVESAHKRQQCAVR